MGFLYCFVNESMPGIYKIGFTERTVEERLKDANSPNTWSPPHKYEVLFYAEVENAKNKESLVHKILSVFRIRQDREFFKGVPESMIGAIFELASDKNSVSHKNIAACIPTINLNRGTDIIQSVNVNQTPRTPRSTDIKFMDYMSDGQLIRHKLQNSSLEGMYDEKSKKVKCRMGEFFTLTEFVRFHESQNGTKPKGSHLWKECEIKENGSWMPFEKKEF